MSYKIQTTTAPVDDKGNAKLIEVDGAELTDLLRWGLVVLDKGDIDKDGKLRKAVVEDAAPEVLTVTGQVPVQQLQKMEA